MNRSQVRELAFKLLYQIEIQKEVSNEDIELFFENNQINSEEAKEYVEDVINGVAKESTDIIEEISKNLKQDWEVDRISKINLALLKLAIYEILFTDTPYKVAINEVVELSKKYSEDGSSNFINGVLASIVKENEEN